jgi:hypothetical protein
VIRVVFSIYADRQAADDGGEPIDQREFVATRESRITQDAISDPATGQVVVPEVRMPSFSDVVAGNEPVVTEVVDAIYRVSAGFPDFTGATKV